MRPTAAATPAEERMHLLAEVNRRALNDRREWLGITAINGRRRRCCRPSVPDLMSNHDPEAHLSRLWPSRTRS
jgi:hypothetical protein